MKKEMKLWSLLKHPNILPFLGYCFSPATPHEEADGIAILSLVSPFMERGDAVRYLWAHPDVNRLSILEGLLRGVSYLHSMNIVHRDIKGSNVLINDSGSAVLADFGVSTFLENNRYLQSNSGTSFTSSGTIRGSLRWMAPELVLGNSQTPSKGSDMWSVGCTLMELAILAAPYVSYKLDVQVIAAMLQKELPFDDVCVTGGNMHQSQYLVSRLWTVCLECWQSDNTNRPSADDVSAAITSFR
ncbi:kinase-like protein [Sistotremastrum niveocremeum HHB9708]|uniref:Kinase-like protein n=1 Tax=Sistotremastrum niveocremeum HHB9708 TaxID=1314777 RepID=A0A164T572_9AGAM|nr:kinase-like protein [Sistotremastrum niveocremeum HHB9708]